MESNKEAIGKARTEVAAIKDSGMSREEIDEAVKKITNNLMDALRKSVGRLTMRASDYIFGLPGGMQKIALVGLTTLAKKLKDAARKAIKFVLKVVKAVKEFASGVWNKVWELFNSARDACSF